MRVRLPRPVTAVTAASGLIVSGAAVLALAPAATAEPVQPTPDCTAAATCTVTYTSVGAAQTFTVPDLVDSVVIAASGGAGGGTRGGKGGTTSGRLSTMPGTALTVVVGGKGASSGSTPTFGGGGAVAATSSGGSGGGGSFVYAASGSLLLAAGGGGGDGLIVKGGDGSGANAAGGDGVNAFPASGSDSTTAATGGTQSAGGRGGSRIFAGSPVGAGGDGSGPAANGNAGQGGSGSDSSGTNLNPVYGGGGGGGGYFGGGGGGGAQSGAGGSGFAAGTLTDVSSQTGQNSLAGSVTFTWSKVASTTSLTANPQSGDAVSGNSVTLTATVTSGSGTPTGTVTFTADETTVTGCGAVAVGGNGVATCTTSFSAGKHSLGAAYSGSSAYASSVGTLDYNVASLPTISTGGSLPSGTVGVPYSQTLTGTGGTGTNYSYAFANGGERPFWLSLSDGGVLSGTPNSAGDSAFKVTISDGTRSTSKSFTLKVAKGSQTVDFTFAPTNPAVGGSYAITSVTPGKADTDVAFTGNDNCSLDGTTVTFTHAGTCTVTASQAGDADYEDATPTSHEVTVGKGTQALMVTSNPPSSGVVGASHTLTVAGGASGADVSIGLSDSTTNSACTVGEVSSSFDDLSGRPTSSAPVSFDKAGSCVLTLTQGGNDDYSAATPSFVTIQVTGKATSTSLSLSTANAVHGEPVTVTAHVRGGAAGTVNVLVDGTSVASRMIDNETDTVDDVPLPVLAVGTHQVTASFTPSDLNTYAASGTGTASTLTVTPSSTTTTVKVNANSVVATVTVNAPSLDVPSGSVEFFVDGKSVGTATIVAGTATLNYTAPTGKTVAASYSGAASGEVVQTSSSSASTARTNPTVTATVSSRKAKSKAGWYSAPVTISYRCTAGSGAVTCPKPVTVTRDGLTTVTRKVMADDGGIATVATTVKVDRTRPTVKVTGIRNGGTYPTLPKIGCAASDKTSGIASCVLTRTVGGSTTTTFVATATDRAGNTSRSTVTIRRSPVLITGADYRGSIPTVKRGKGYTLVYTGKGTPRYVNAAPSPRAPKGDGGAFTKIGKNRWAYSVVFTKSLKKHPVWNFGVKVGKRTITVSVRVVK